MRLYLISQDINNRYETYDSAVVAAESEDAARVMHPSGDVKDNLRWDWADPKDVTVKLIGTATPGTPAGVICASYNAG